MKGGNKPHFYFPAVFMVGTLFNDKDESLRNQNVLIQTWLII